MISGRGRKILRPYILLFLVFECAKIEKEFNGVFLKKKFFGYLFLEL